MLNVVVVVHPSSHDLLSEWTCRIFKLRSTVDHPPSPPSPHGRRPARRPPAPSTCRRPALHPSLRPPRHIALNHFMNVLATRRVCNNAIWGAPAVPDRTDVRTFWAACCMVVRLVVRRNGAGTHTHQLAREQSKDIKNSMWLITAHPSRASVSVPTVERIENATD